MTTHADAPTATAAIGAWLNADQTAHYLGLPSRKALYQAVRRGQIPVHRLGARRMRFHRDELDRLLAGGTRRRRL